MSDTAASIYAELGAGNATVGSELTAHEMEMIGLATDVRNGDEVINVAAPEEVKAEEPEAEPEYEEPEEEEPEEESETEAEDGIEPADDALPEGTDGSELATMEVQLSAQAEATKSLLEDAVTKGMDASLVDQINNEYDAGEGLSEASYKALADAGYSKAFVTSYIAGQEAVAQQFATSVVAYAGGQDAFTKVQAFMSANNPDAVTAFNAAVNRADSASIKALISSTKAQMGKTYGNRPARTVAVKAAAPAPAVANDGFTSSSEMVKAMSDRRYMMDTEYRKDVERRVMLSNF